MKWETYLFVYSVVLLPSRYVSVKLLAEYMNFVRFLSFNYGNCTIEGYSMYLGFQTSKIKFLIFRTAADLTWYCTKYAGFLATTHKY